MITDSCSVSWRTQASLLHVYIKYLKYVPRNLFDHSYKFDRDPNKYNLLLGISGSSSARYTHKLIEKMFETIGRDKLTIRLAVTPTFLSEAYEFLDVHQLYTKEDEFLMKGEYVKGERICLLTLGSGPNENGRMASFDKLTELVLSLVEHKLGTATPIASTKTVFPLAEMSRDRLEQASADLAQETRDCVKRLSSSAVNESRIIVSQIVSSSFISSSFFLHLLGILVFFE
uniref:Flavoprotein domain-containing protein n=1 Tax=Ditylenchus dipsaci TaxID=166011 RepID=A0A915CZ59_9BILA